jgi:outer membrane immunogenic protein
MIVNKLLASAFTLSFLASSGFAADLPSHKAPLPAPPPPAPLWTGFYAGLNAGYSWSNANALGTATGVIKPFPADVGAPPFFGQGSSAAALSATGVANAPMGGFIGGGQIGYNYQFNNFVAGVEADIQGATVSGGGGFLNAAIEPVFRNDLAVSNVDTRRSVDWLGTVRGRVGYLLAPNFLVFGTGGLAYGGITATTRLLNGWSDVGNLPCSGIACSASSLGGIGSVSKTAVGWTAGGGFEWMVMPNVSLKAEYLYYDLGAAAWTTTWSVSGFIPSFIPIFPQAGSFLSAHRAHFDGHIARAGVNYHFDFGAPAPVVASY